MTDANGDHTQQEELFKKATCEFKDGSEIMIHGLCNNALNLLEYELCIEDHPYADIVKFFKYV